MTRKEELSRMIDKSNNNGMSIDEWTMLLLMDIAYSLAVIADKMTEGEVEWNRRAKDESD